MTAYVPKGAINRAIVRIYTSLFFKGAPAVPVFTNAGAPTNGTSGTLAGIAAPGALLINTTAKTLYQNANTLASPTWTLFSVASGAGDFTGTFQGTVGNVTPAAATVSTFQVDTGTKTAAATAGAATLNKSSGRVTSEALTTAAGALYTLTLTNSAIAAADTVMAMCGNGTNSAGVPNICSVTPAAGSVVIIVQNTHASAALNGTLIVTFVVLKA